MCTTHEAFIAKVAELAIARLTAEDKFKLASLKLVYGAGSSGIRGITYFNAWKTGDKEPQQAPFVEICAFGQEHWLQVAGTTIHELGHALAGWQAGHGKDWHAACAKLGLRRIKAAGTSYKLANFDPKLRLAIAALNRPDEGEPARALPVNRNGRAVLKPCGAGIGTRGGKTRGPGSGSRLRKYVCQCKPAVIIRAGRDDLACTCDHCRAGFTLA